MKGKTYDPRFFGEYEALAEKMLGNTYCDELTAIIQKFMTNPLCYQDCMVNYFLQHKTDDPLVQVLQPMTDVKLLFEAYHYAGATSNRTEAGKQATAVVSYFVDHASKNLFTTTLKLAELYYLINFVASSREKFLRLKEKTLSMEEVKEQLRQMPNQTEMPILAEVMPGSDVTDEQREVAIDSYAQSAKNTVPTLLLDLEHVLTQAYLNAVPEKRAALEALLENLSHARKAHQSEVEDIEAFEAFFKM